MKFPNFADRNTKIAAAGAAGVAALALYLRARKNATSGAAGSSSGSTGMSVTDPLAAAALGQASTESAIVSDLQPLIEGLQQQVAGLQSAAPAPPAPTSAPPKAVKLSLPQLHSTDFLQSINADSGDLLPIGTLNAQGKFTGENVIEGAPVYYEAPGSNVAVQGAPRPGAKVFTLRSLSGYVSPNKVTNQ